VDPKQTLLLYLLCYKGPAFHHANVYGGLILLPIPLQALGGVGLRGYPFPMYQAGLLHVNLLTGCDIVKEECHKPIDEQSRCFSTIGYFL